MQQVDQMILKITAYSSRLIVLTVTAFVVISSVFIVYMIAFITQAQYTELLLFLSILLPLVLAPITIYKLVRVIEYLKLVKKKLEYEIEKNHSKDIMLFEQERFALMGEMMANISHQWKQPLNTINLAMLNAKMQPCYCKELEDNFTIIEDSVNYLASTIDDFVSFLDKRSSSEKRALKSIVKEVSSITYSYIRKKDIQFDIEHDESIQNIEVSTAISQVILNLLNNAKDALEDSKEANKRLLLRFVITEERLKIYCCDNGIGIKPHVAARIFDPYFTTKPKTQGTGIGLYMSKQIVQKLFHGRIELVDPNTVENKSFKTCFVLSIPYTKECYRVDAIQR